MGIGKFAAEKEDDDAPGGTTAAAPGPGVGIRSRDPWAPPDGWVAAPPQGALACDVFVPSKAPLSERWHRDVPPDRAYGPARALAMAKRTAGGRDVRLVVDLTNSSRYYDPVEVEREGAKYVKVACVGKDAPPDELAVQEFVYVVGKFLADERARLAKAAAANANANANANAGDASSKTKPGVILVHCTHGYNRTGAMLAHYMQRSRPWPDLNAHVAEFARARPPCGIYKPEYLRDLFDAYRERRFRSTVDPPLPDFKKKPPRTDDASDASDAPPVADADVPDDDLFSPMTNEAYRATRVDSAAPRPGDPRSSDEIAGAGAGATTASGNADGSPMRHDDVVGDAVFEGQAAEIRAVVAYLCGAVNTNGGSRFPGSQPVSLARDNMAELKRREYHVTWKADGTRYLLLLMRDGTYLIDRKFAIRRVQMRFPANHRAMKGPVPQTHNATLLDGEMVVDDIPAPAAASGAEERGKKKKIVGQRRRFLAYDAAALNGESLVDRPFAERWGAIHAHVVEPRNAFLADAGKTGSYDFTREPFSVRAKEFSPLAGTARFLREFIPRLTHECDGLIFQPSDARYECGTMTTLLKWKFTHLNSVDFLLRDGKLFVGGEGGRLSEAREPTGAFHLGREEAEAEGVDPGDPGVASLDGKIVECTWDKDEGAWRFLRVRSDKDAPNFVTVYRHTLGSILDDITSDEIVGFVADALEERRIAREKDAPKQDVPAYVHDI